MDVPHLKMPQVIQYDLEHIIVEKHLEIEAWFREKWAQNTPLITCSVDIRNAGFKLSPVDTNVFPAGFNNLNPDFMPLCVQAMNATLSHRYTGCKTVCIIPESHTRNPFYLSSLYTIQSILNQAGFDAKIGTLRDIDKPEVLSINGHSITQYPISKKDNKLYVDNDAPCLVLLNNDLTEGMPAILQDIKQPIIPSPQRGWNIRSKTKHFEQLQILANELGQLLNIDSWLLAPLFSDCGNIDFSSKDSDKCVVSKTEKLFEAIAVKYSEFGIKEKPFVVIKSDAGTYGMAIMMIQDPAEIQQLNRKQRAKMSKIKGGKTVDRVLIQEGVYTMETLGPLNATAEPVVYMIGEYVIGGFYRVHTGKGVSDNLNAPGMHFEPLAFETCCNSPDERLNPHESKNLFYVYSVLARLAHLATLYEIS